MSMAALIRDAMRIGRNDDEVGDILARIADEFERGSHTDADSIRIEIDRNGPDRRVVRIRSWRHT